jgi:hypothetical protein
MGAPCTFSLATDRYAMSSSEPLGTPSTDYVDMQKFDTIAIDDDYQQPPSPGPGTSAAPCGGTTAPSFADTARKRKRLVFPEEEVGHMTFKSEAIKAMVVVITNASHMTFTLGSIPCYHGGTTLRL